MHASDIIPLDTPYIEPTALEIGDEEEADAAEPEPLRANRRAKDKTIGKRRRAAVINVWTLAA